MNGLTPIQQAARDAFHAGLCTIPPREDGSKAPAAVWRKYQHARPDQATLKGWWGSCTGLGVVCGKVSGNLELFEFDEPHTYQAYKDLAHQAELGDLVARLEAGYCEDTPSGGVHWLYRCSEIGGSTKLAKRVKRPDERKAPDDTIKTLIETKGEGGFVIVAPSNGRVHPTGRPYRLRSGGFQSIPTLTPDERAALHQLARAFDEMPAKQPPPQAAPERLPAGGDLRPGDDYTARSTWPELLEPRGWTAIGQQGERTLWRRPGKREGLSATTNHAGSDLLWVFSTSTPFESERSYDRFGAYAVLEHGGDQPAAARALAARGYGTPARQPVNGQRNALAPQAQGDTASASAEPQSRPDGAQEPVGLADADLADAVDVALEGQQIEAQGIPYLVPGMIPQLGMLGFLVAFAKVGKTTFAQSLAAAVAMGREFLNRPTVRARVLVIAAEDPPEYVAWLARHLDVERGWMTFYRRSILLTPSGLEAIGHTVKAGGYGLVLIASWQAVIRGLVQDENDNAGAVCVVESVKTAARATGVPWLIDAHSGKGEDQADEADPSRAMRGASAAAGAADYTLSLRYANGAFGTQRRLSGRGRFVSLEPTVIDFDASTSEYSVLGTTKNALVETTWRLICDAGALTDEPRTAGEIARAAGMVGDDDRPTRTHKRQVGATLAGRDGVLKSEELRHGKKTTLYRHAPEVTA